MKYRIVLKITVLIFIILAVLYNVDMFPKGEIVEYGVTFSQKQAQSLGLEWKSVFDAITDDLRVDNIRLVAYWDIIEPQKEQYDFKDLDYMVEKAGENNIKIVLVMGHRVPRWPECHAPKWAGELTYDRFEESLLSFLKKVILRYKNHNAIIAWQVENEPFLTVFGLCPPPDESLLKKEIETVKSTDDRPIIITDSGELGLWKNAGEYGDIFGTTMYLQIWNKILGNFRWSLPPAYYAIKYKIFVPSKPFYLMELQMEPWGSNFRFIGDIPIGEQLQVFSTKNIKEHLNYAKQAGFKNIYLWGAEWWYWLKTRGYDDMWKEAKTIWGNST